VAFVLPVTFAGFVQLAPASLENESLTSEFVHGLPVPSLKQLPPAKSAQATNIVLSEAMTAVGKLLDLKPRPGTAPNEGSAFLSRKRAGLERCEATSAGALQLTPPSVDLENLMLKDLSQQ
jgi:hypothetical protein